MNILSICESPSVLEIMNIVVTIIKVIMVVVPIILLFSLIFKAVSAVTKNDQDALATLKKKAVSNIVAAAAIFLVPVLVSLIVTISFPESDYNKCIKDISSVTIQEAYEDKAEKLVSRAEETLNINDYITAMNYMPNVKDDTKRESYEARLEVVRSKIDEVEGDPIYNDKSTVLAEALNTTLNENVYFNNKGNVLLFGSDYQGGKRKENLTNILENISNNGISPDLIMILGDYSDAGDPSNSKKGIEEANGVIRSFTNFSNSGILYLQGNHDSMGVSNYLIKTGAYETDNYIIFAINEDDFHCSYHDTCTVLDEYLDSVANSKSSKPIFVLTHIPLHATSRADNKSAYLIIDTLNKYGDALDIIVMFGHNHSGSYDRCNGGSTTYFDKGSTMEIYRNNKTVSETINFTYLNAGYVGNVASSYSNGTVKCNGVIKEISKELTMTLFTINKSSIEVDRYSKDAILSHNIINRMPKKK